MARALLQQLEQVQPQPPVAEDGLIGAPPGSPDPSGSLGHPGGAQEGDVPEVLVAWSRPVPAPSRPLLVAPRAPGLNLQLLEGAGHLAEVDRD